MQKLPRVELPARLENSLQQGHPWIYRDQVPKDMSAPAGSFIEVRCGRFVGYALWDPDSALALRVYSRVAVPDDAWLAARVAEAWRAREALLETGTNAFRWVYGEADGLPGIVVDVYAGHAIVVCDTPACHQLAQRLTPLLVQTHQLESVLLRHRHRQSADRLTTLWGKPPTGPLLVEENHLRFVVDLAAGQKTGLFLDHRENRASIERIAAGRRVLNLFAYSGAFSLYALRGGAHSVVDVDIAADASRDAVENVRLNGFDSSRHSFEVADVFEFLERERQGGRRFDLIICDPPTFARNKTHLDKALKAYERVNAAGMKLSTAEGLYAAASCTARVTPSAFKQTLANSARRAKLRMLTIQERGQPVDHPELIGHPEGRYLKFVLGRLLPRA